MLEALAGDEAALTLKQITRIAARQPRAGEALGLEIGD